MARMTTADAIVAVLEKEGVTKAFGVPGAAINPLYAAMRRRGSIDHILARHVEGASHMAEGYTRAAPGNIGVCIGIEKGPHDAQIDLKRSRVAPLRPVDGYKTDLVFYSDQQFIFSRAHRIDTPLIIKKPEFLLLIIVIIFMTNLLLLHQNFRLFDNKAAC